MRIRLFAAILATCLLAACGGTDTGAGTDAVATGGIPDTLPATVEGEVYFDLGESELEPSDLNASMTADIGFNPGDDEDSVMLRVPGDKLKAAGVTGEGERVRATISGKTQENGIDYYIVTAFEKL